MNWKNMNDFLSWFKGGWSFQTYNVKDVDAGFKYWYSYLKDIVFDLIVIDGCPENMPSKEIIHHLIIEGHSTVIKHPKYGIMTTFSSLYDYDINGHYLNATIYNQSREFYDSYVNTPKRIGRDCAVIYIGDCESYVNNPASVNKLNELIARYARMLADVESSIDTNLIMSRKPYLFTAKNQQIKDAIVAMLRGIERGKDDAVVDDDFLGESKSIKNYDLQTGLLTELIDARNSILKQFLQQMGIYSTDDKKERLIVSEVEQENRNVKPFITSLLKAINEGCDQVNKVFSLNLYAHVNEEVYDRSEIVETEEVEESENVEEEVKNEENV